MTLIPHIIPLAGLNNLHFGAISTEAIKLFGEPDEQEELHDEILNDHSLVYHYWDLGFSLFFNVHANFVFTCAEVDNKEAILYGKKIFSLTEKEIIELFKLNGHKLSDSEQHEWGERRISFDTAMVDLYFVKGKLESVNFAISEETQNFVYFPN